MMKVALVKIGSLVAGVVAGSALDNSLNESTHVVDASVVDASFDVVDGGLLGSIDNQSNNSNGNAMDDALQRGFECWGNPGQGAWYDYCSFCKKYGNRCALAFGNGGKECGVNTNCCGSITANGDYASRAVSNCRKGHWNCRLAARDGELCPRAMGRWVNRGCITNRGGRMTGKITNRVTKGYSHSMEVQSTIKAGFKYGGASVSATVKTRMATSYMSSTSSGFTTESTCPPGNRCIWQWRMDMYTGNGLQGTTEWDSGFTSCTDSPHISPRCAPYQCWNDALPDTVLENITV